MLADVTAELDISPAFTICLIERPADLEKNSVEIGHKVGSFFDDCTWKACPELQMAIYRCTTSPRFFCFHTQIPPALYIENVCLMNILSLS